MFEYGWNFYLKWNWASKITSALPRNDSIAPLNANSTSNHDRVTEALNRYSATIKVVSL